MAWNCTHCHRHGNLSGSWIPPTFTSSQLQRCLEPLWSKGIWPSCPGTRRLHKRHQHRHIYPQINDPYNDRWKDITYIHLVCAICTKKKEPNHTWATLGSNLISYPQSYTAEMPKFAKIKPRNILEEIIQEYNLQDKATPDRWVYMHCIWGMYDIPHTSSLGHDLLEEHLNASG